MSTQRVNILEFEKEMQKKTKGAKEKAHSRNINAVKQKQQ